jgi:anti-sigma-K factor RskA
MYPDFVTAVMRVPFLRTSSYVNNENGAASPGRWQVAQFWRMIGAMVSVNVTAVAACNDLPANEARPSKIALEYVDIFPAFINVAVKREVPDT